MISPATPACRRAPDTPGWDEVLSENAETRIVRRHLPGGVERFIAKEALGPSAVRRVRQETAILQRLAGVRGVPALRPGAGEGPTLIAMEDVGAVPLTVPRRDAPFDRAAFLVLARQLALILADVHRRGVVHKDVNPGNIMLSGAARSPMLIDFDVATTFVGERPGFSHHREIAGTLAYLAPEQTGRTGWTVDQRADLYALGATLYELAVGHPPFEAGDPLELIHDVLATTPRAPDAIDPQIPRVISAMIMRLLEKDPERRYQSAEGLAHDLARVLADATGTAPFPIGERDFPQRLSPPSRLIGREAEVAALRTALDGAFAGGRRGLLVTGAPGVGKSALVNELRPMVTARRGWFVAGKFDQYRQDSETDAVRQALRGLVRLLLAEPEHELRTLRPKIAAALGDGARVLAAHLPELAALLGTPGAATADALGSESRIVQLGVELLRTIASPERPVVLVLDDLQWSSIMPISLIDAILLDRRLTGVLLVGAYRDADVGPAHPLAAMVVRWQRLDAVCATLHLHNLPQPAVGRLIGEMLRLDRIESRRLAEAVGARSGGNPYDTVELINALRRDGLLAAGDAGWTWDADEIRRYVGHGDVVDLIVARFRLLPGATWTLLETVACLGGVVELSLLAAAGGFTLRALETLLIPALEDGLLVMEHRTQEDDGSVRFRHDRVQQAAYASIEIERRPQAHLALARRLAADERFAEVAAEQYLPAVDALDAPAERRRVVGLFRRAAAAAHPVNDAVAERYLTAALALTGRDANAPNDALVSGLQAELHSALYGLGRLVEADVVFSAIERFGDSIALADAACTQVSSLTNRNHYTEALDLGLMLLRRLGVDVPDGDMSADVARRLPALAVWADAPARAHDLARPELDDRRLRVIARLANRMLPPAFFCDPSVLAWLVLESARMWDDDGPSAELIGPLTHAGFVLIGLCDDYAGAYRAGRRVLAIAEGRGYEAETSHARFLFTLGAAHWFDALEQSVPQARLAREGLLLSGDVQNTCFSFYASIEALIDCAPTLEAFSIEVDAAIAFAARTGNDQVAGAIGRFRTLVRTLRGDAASLDTFGDPPPGASPIDAFYAHLPRALVAALRGDADALIEHAARAMESVPAMRANYLESTAHLLAALALAARLHVAPADDAEPLLRELDRSCRWLAERAADAPGNFRHLVRLVQAERAWATGDFHEAVAAFDAALQEAETRGRPWHRAVIAERGGLCHLAHGLERSGRSLLAEARSAYQAWGATAKVDDLDRAHPFLIARTERPQRDAGRASGGISSAAVDLLAIVSAAQALGSETNVDRLRTRVVELLGEMTGATVVTVALWDDDAHEWFLPAPPGETGVPISVEAAGALGRVPGSAFRYAERTREALLLDDATRDDRFAGDPYFADVECCSLLLVPILSAGVPRAMLILENRLTRSAFSADRLDGVMLIAGQLAVSLENAQLYASLERKVAERTDSLALANRQLALLSVTDPLTGLANRRRFADVLDVEWLRALRSKDSIGAAMIDVDHFKRYNDAHGHIAGDACLRRVADVLSESVRAGDVVARYGGEEFAIIFPRADLAACRPVAERARAAVAALAAADGGPAGGLVTVSIGIAAVVPSAATTAVQLVEASDAALYEAKRAGRDRVR